MRCLHFFIPAFVASTAAGQVGQRLAQRHARIQEVYEAENYAGTIREIDAQLVEVPGTAWADSVHKYLYKYARAHRKVNDADAGAAAGERILAMVKQRGNAKHEVEALFDLSWYYYDIGRMKDCVRVDSTAVVIADSDPSIPVSQRGRARQYVAFDYSVIGDHANSAKYAQAALEQYSMSDSVLHTQLAESNTTVGVAYWHLGRIRQAETYYMKALAILGERTDLPSLIRKVSTNGNLGVMWQNAGDFARAKTFYHESLRLSDQVIAATDDPFTRDEAIVNRSRTYLNLATVHQQLGDDGRARELLEIAWKDRSSVLEPDDPQLLTVKDRMADVELAAGAVDKAEEIVTAYVSACERKFGRRSEEYIRACSKLGEIAQRKGDQAKADSLFNVSIAAGKLNADAATDAVLALTLQRRARMNVERGRTAEAIADLQQARQVMVNVYDGTHYKVAACDVLLAETALEGGDAQAALTFSRSALALLDGRARALRASTVPQTFPDPHLLPDAIYWNVSAQRALAGKGAVKPEWNTDLDLAITSLARNKAAVLDEASKLLLIGAQKNLFDLAMEVAYDAHAGSKDEAAIERFLALSEADRSILLKDRINGFAGLRFAGVPDSITTREQELINALDIDEADRAATTDMDQREQDYADFVRQLEQRYPQYFALRYGEPKLTLAGIRRRLLNSDRQLLSYAWIGDHIYAMVVGMKDAAIVRMSSTGIADVARTMNAAIASRDVSGYRASAFALYEGVFAPVADRITAPELLIIPDGPLHTVSFEALITREGGSGGSAGDLLLQRHTMAYLLSATTAIQFADLAREQAGGVLAVAPGFDDDLKESYVSSVADTTQIDHDYLRYVRQPFAVSTAQGLGELLSANVLVGNAANEKDVRELAVRYGILHLGTHAEMNAASPMYSRLVLSKDGSGVDAGADGYLHAYEIYELDLRAQLAVLTACETGTGRQDAGEGVRSLGYGFAYAGCPSLVVSLWKIDEQASSKIITRFYELLADGLPKHKALRQAKLDHLATATGDLAQPYYWAGMVLMGDVAPVEDGRGVPWYGWAACGLAMAGIIGWMMRRGRS